MGFAGGYLGCRGRHLELQCIRWLLAIAADLTRALSCWISRIVDVNAFNDHRRLLVMKWNFWWLSLRLSAQFTITGCHRVVTSNAKSLKGFSVIFSGPKIVTKHSLCKHYDITVDVVFTDTDITHWFYWFCNSCRSDLRESMSSSHRRRRYWQGAKASHTPSRDPQRIRYTGATSTTNNSTINSSKIRIFNLSYLSISHVLKTWPFSWLRHGNDIAPSRALLAWRHQHDWSVVLATSHTTVGGIKIVNSALVLLYLQMRMESILNTEPRSRIG